MGKRLLGKLNSIITIFVLLGFCSVSNGQGYSFKIDIINAKVFVYEMAQGQTILIDSLMYISNYDEFQIDYIRENIFTIGKTNSDRNMNLFLLNHYKVVDRKLITVRGELFKSSCNRGRLNVKYKFTNGYLLLECNMKGKCYTDSFQFDNDFIDEFGKRYYSFENKMMTLFDN